MANLKPIPWCDSAVLTPDSFHFSPAIAEIIQNRLAGRDPCPVLAWAVHVGGLNEDSLTKQIGTLAPNAVPLEVVRFHHRISGTSVSMTDARVVIVKRPAS